MNNLIWKQLPATLKLLSVVRSWCGVKGYEFKTWKMHNGNQALCCVKLERQLQWSLSSRQFRWWILDFVLSVFGESHDSWWGRCPDLQLGTAWTFTSTAKWFPSSKFEGDPRGTWHICKLNSGPSTMSLSTSARLWWTSWIYRSSRPLWGRYRTCKNCVECILLQQGVCYIEEI